LKKILLGKKFFKLIKECAVIFSEFFGTFLHFSNLAILKNLKSLLKILKKITAYSLINSKNFQQNFFQKSIIFK